MQKSTQIYNLAWHMGISSNGPVRYLLIPVGANVRGHQRFDTVLENGKPDLQLTANRYQLCSLRSDSCDSGKQSAQEILLIGTLKSRAQEGGHQLPEIEATTEMPAWSAWGKEPHEHN